MDLAMLASLTQFVSARGTMGVFLKLLAIVG